MHKIRKGVEFIVRYDQHKKDEYLTGKEKTFLLYMKHIKKGNTLFLCVKYNATIF